MYEQYIDECAFETLGIEEEKIQLIYWRKNTLIEEKKQK
jgi:hypothetical protein